MREKVGVEYFKGLPVFTETKIPGAPDGCELVTVQKPRKRVAFFECPFTAERIPVVVGWRNRLARPLLCGMRCPHIEQCDYQKRCLAEFSDFLLAREMPKGSYDELVSTGN